MLVTMADLLILAQRGGYAVGGFNVYNLEGIAAVIQAAEAESSPAILQVHPGAYAYGGLPLLQACLAAARQTALPVAVHLDHTTDSETIRIALEAGVTSVMADGSHLPDGENIAFATKIVAKAKPHGVTVEAELGRIAGTEDDLTVEAFEARFTDPTIAADFVAQTKIDALAVCIGNVHGKYPRPPQLDFERLAAIRAAVTVPLVLHGASGLPTDQIQQAITGGVCKFNVNTDVRGAFVYGLRSHLEHTPASDLLPLMSAGIQTMSTVIRDKMQLFGSSSQG